MSNTKFQPWRRFVRNDLVGYQDIISALQVVFEGKIIHTQHCIEKKDLMLTFLKNNLE